MFVYRAAILETLPAVLKKRTKNSEKSINELNELFAESEKYLLSTINGPKTSELPAFEEEIWISLVACLETIIKDIKDAECAGRALSLLQLQLSTVPKGIETGKLGISKYSLFRNGIEGFPRNR